MPSLWLIHCEDCGAPRRTSAKNTKFCVTCRYLRDASYWQVSGRAQKCTSCGDADYLPFHTGYKLCGNCSFTHPRDRGTCALCDTHGANLIQGHRVCYSCASSPARRPKFLDALAKRQSRQSSRFASFRGTPARPYSPDDDDLLQEAADA